MSSLKVLMYSCFLLLLFSCNKEAARNECIQHFLDEYKMVEYNDESLGCKNYIIMYEKGNTSFVILNNRCADMMPQLLIDCSGNELCTYITDEGCPEMVRNSTVVGIVGITQ